MIIYLRQTPSIKLPFGSDCWDCRYVCRHPAGYSDWVRASLRFTNKFLNIANKNSPPKTKACSLSCCMMYSCQSSVWFFATRGWLSDLSSLGNARKDASNGSIHNQSINQGTSNMQSNFSSHHSHPMCMGKGLALFGDVGGWIEPALFSWYSSSLS